MKYYTNEGKTYCVVGTAEGTVTSASGVVIASFSANEQNYFTAPAGGFVTISDDTAIVTPVFKLAPSALVGESGGGDSPTPSPTPSGDYSDWCGYIEYDDETGVIVDCSIPKYLTVNLTFQNADFPANYDWKFDMPYLTNGQKMFHECSNIRSFSVDLPALTNGEDMFYNCKLDAASVERILTTIPTYTDGSTHILTLYCSSEAAAKFAEITGVTIMAFLPKQVSYKGWKIMAKVNNA